MSHPKVVETARRYRLDAHAQQFESRLPKLVRVALINTLAGCRSGLEIVTQPVDASPTLLRAQQVYEPPKLAVSTAPTAGTEGELRPAYPSLRNVAERERVGHYGWGVGGPLAALNLSPRAFLSQQPEQRDHLTDAATRYRRHNGMAIERLDFTRRHRQCELPGEPSHDFSLSRMLGHASPRLDPLSLTQISARLSEPFERTSPRVRSPRLAIAAAHRRPGRESAASVASSLASALPPPRYDPVPAS
eukprot:tig00021537_g22291.t1